MRRPSEIDDVYERIGVSRDSSFDEVKKAYKAKALKWHPDRHEDKEMAHLEFIAVSDAYERISINTGRKPMAESSSRDRARDYSYYSDIFENMFSDEEFQEIFRSNPTMKLYMNFIKGLF